MRLLHTKDLYFRDFLRVQSRDPEYAIISHRWTDQELTFEQFNSSRDGPRESYGWLKLLKGCQIASDNGIDWLWMDTCCIDKSSSAELSEAINSMYAWYRDAGVCYVFLQDVSGGLSSQPNTPLADQSNRFDRQFKTSAWFQRGWTLQELLAPNRMMFFNRDFQYTGTKRSLEELIARTTGIDSRYLLGSLTSREISIAERMKWASKRHTTREEDLAYCLLGIFDVNMPLLYGEGRKAFVRLQLEIIKKTDDESIFAWMHNGAWNYSSAWSGVLAPNPAAFAQPSHPHGGAWYYPPCDGKWHSPEDPQGPQGLYGDSPLDIAGAKVYSGRGTHRRPYTMTNKGLEFTLHVHHKEHLSAYFRQSFREVFLPLDCSYVVQLRDGSQKVFDLAIRLRLAGHSTQQFWHAAKVGNLLFRSSEGSVQEPRFGVDAINTDWAPSVSSNVLRGLPDQVSLTTMTIYVEQQDL